ncbi:MAG: hypothetical protein LC776_18860 [Acidobacteria bacterium]|nr:hypothetical protein [Acidobacteriota bacterium]
MRLLLPRIRLRDDQAHRVLIESLKAAFALQVFQVTANRAVAHELLKLILRDGAILEQRVRAFLPHFPARASIVFSFQQLEHPAELLRAGRDTRAVLRKKNWVSVHEKIVCRSAS